MEKDIFQVFDLLHDPTVDLVQAEDQRFDLVQSS